MRVALDATYSIAREPSGVAAYCANLIAGLAAEAPEDRFDLYYRANRYLKALGEPPPGANCSRRLLEPPLSPIVGRFGVFHGLNQRLPKGRFERAITTFHDLFVMTGEYSTPEFRRRFTELARDAAARSDEIIAVSAFTGEQVSGLLGFPKERITVVHHGVDPAPSFAGEELELFRKKEGLEGPFLLNIGALQTRKNIARLVEAFETLDHGPLLVLAGAAGFGAEEIVDRIEASPARERIRMLGYIDAERRAKLYRTATALAFPSLDEGFGIPVLEAMCAELPVLTSDRSALPEAAGDAALLVDPEQTDAIHDGLTRLLEDEALRAKLSEAGAERVRAFTWEAAVKKTLAVYRRAR